MENCLCFHCGLPTNGSQIHQTCLPYYTSHLFSGSKDPDYTRDTVEERSKKRKVEQEEQEKQEELEEPEKRKSLKRKAEENTCFTCDKFLDYYVPPINHDGDCLDCYNKRSNYKNVSIEEFRKD